MGQGRRNQRPPCRHNKLCRHHPEGWANDRGPALKNINDAVIYEMHHRDYSMHPSSGIVNKGKFLALTEEGTRSLLGDKTGIDHLKELGITHIHILPLLRLQ